MNTELDLSATGIKPGEPLRIHPLDFDELRALAIDPGTPPSPLFQVALIVDPAASRLPRKAVP